MFRIDPNSGYWRTVKFFTYAETGTPEEHQLRVKYRYLKRSEIKALFEPKAKPKDEDGQIEGQAGPGAEFTDVDVCRRVVMGIQVIQGEGLEGSCDEIMESLMEIPNLPELISTAYFTSLRELREKNFPTPPATG